MGLNIAPPVGLKCADRPGVLHDTCIPSSSLAAVALFVSVSSADAAEMKILTAGAMKAVVLELVPAFEKETGHKAVVDNDTAGGLARRIEGGEAFDLAIITPGVINDLAGKGKIVAGSRVNVARVGRRRHGQGRRADAGRRAMSRLSSAR